MARFLNPPSDAQIKITPATHRFFSDLVIAQTGISALCYRDRPSNLLSAGAKLNVSTVCFNFDYEIDIDAAELFSPLIAATEPSVLTIKFRHTPNNPCRNPSAILSNPYQRMFASFFYQAFISYYEKNVHMMRHAHGTDPNSWPDVLRFARAIRNSFAHDGRVHFSNQKQPSVQWGNISYSFADNGRQVLYNDITNGDVMILMIEMDSEF